MKRYFTLYFLFSANIILQAQDFNSPVFRGELVEKYTYPITGSVYAYSDEFETGNVLFNGKRYTDLLLNLDSYRDELQLKVIGTECIALRNSLVGDFNIGKRNYTAFYGENCINGLSEGYYQVLYNGERILLKKIYKNVSEQVHFITGKITKVFTTKFRYYLIMNGKVYKIKDDKDLVKFGKEHKGEIKAFIKVQRRRGFESEDIMCDVMKIIEE